MTFCDPANQLERTEGVKSQTMIGSDLSALLLFGNLADGCQKDALRRAVGEKIEHVFLFGKTVLRKGKQLFCETVVINAGSKTDAVITGKIR